MIELQAVSKVYRSVSIDVRAIDRVDLFIEEGEFVAIMGASGSGKTTLMNILGCLDVPSSGVYRLDGAAVGTLRENQLAKIRSTRIGLVLRRAGCGRLNEHRDVGRRMCAPTHPRAGCVAGRPACEGMRRTPATVRWHDRRRDRASRRKYG